MDPLQPQYMTPEQVADLVARCRAAQDDQRMDAAAARHRPRKISDEAVGAIRAARARGESLRVIADRHDLSIAHVSRIATGIRHAKRAVEPA